MRTSTSGGHLPVAGVSNETDEPVCGLRRNARVAPQAAIPERKRVRLEWLSYGHRIVDGRSSHVRHSSLKRGHQGTHCTKAGSCEERGIESLLRQGPSS